ncbi:MAG TPA: RdgB/HAM1 family non-canonical purine NTP pyrophosphatase [Trueperaceae bacterium]|nr:RdgB/HAM1 family non-canonical purine NTP pyrophosphatase [Trueperaceae bacterium]
MTHRLVVATLNPGKLREFQDALAGADFELVFAPDVGVTSFPPETGASYEENALIKAGHVAAASGLPALADDSGLEVDALGGAPGVYTARFGGPGLTDGERMAHLLRKLRNTPAEQRTAHFRTVIVLATPAGAVQAFHGETQGTILQGPRGMDGFGYDPIFFSPELGKSFAEASIAEKRRVSHRGRALAAFAAWAASDGGNEVLRDTVVRSVETD